MARSKLIKDIVNNNISMEVGLSRLKVIVFDLDNKRANSWIESELNGYKDKDKVPAYREISSDSIVYSGLCGMTQLTNVNMSIYALPENISKKLEHDTIKESIGNVEKKTEVKDGQQIVRNLIHLAGVMFDYNGTQCTSIYQIYDSSQFNSIVTNVKQTIIDILLELEKEFGNLDEMDINLDDKGQDELNKVNKTIVEIIFKDDSIKIGDNNKFKDVKIGSKINED